MWSELGLGEREGGGERETATEPEQEAAMKEDQLVDPFILLPRLII